ncbi:MAG: hypothetical protein DRO04_00140 [Candidatus Iainarchaeum archaeon]|uniref:Uncharacterized protein n=1 Tax=Candidatus Iainarchaeum sp. TaxID=3101447 RepID=A0A497JJN3_9ARCH|nr:MAG: hypothetical protein DRO04_00140 [Candidatus Diapherotrites archaeon]
MRRPLVGIIIASKIKNVENILGFNLEDMLKQVAQILADLGYNILIIPEKNSGSILFANFFREFSKGRLKVFGLIPNKDKEFGIKHLDTKFCDENIYCNSWRSIAAAFVANSSFLICLSYTAGCLVELCQSKYWKKRVLVVREFVSKTLPKEAEQQLYLKYISLRELKPILELVKRYGIKKLK